MATLQPTQVTCKLFGALALFLCLGLLSACDEGSSSTVSPPSLTPTPTPASR
ncbi:hypothetical protein [Synechococcus sp. H60.4]|uniref:hypothetical protein n=1 Tax=unclassified Synechococcus TaxID=2626047 RepID=UPI0039C0A179